METVLYGDNPERERLVSALNVPLDGGSVAGIFTIARGPIMPLALIMEIVEAVSANNCNAQLVANPLRGIDTDICAVVDIISAAIGDFFYIDGAIANAWIKAAPNTALPIGIGTDIPVIFPEGTIDLSLSNSNPTSGIANLYLRYRSLVDGVRVSGS